MYLVTFWDIYVYVCVYTYIYIYIYISYAYTVAAPGIWYGGCPFGPEGAEKFFSPLFLKFLTVHGGGGAAPPATPWSRHCAYIIRKYMFKEYAYRLYFHLYLFLIYYLHTYYSHKYIYPSKGIYISYTYIYSGIKHADFFSYYFLIYYTHVVH